MLRNSIPFVDMREKTPVDLLRAYPDKAHSLITAARGSWGMASRIASAVALPLTDKRSHQWLKRNNDPYLYEIENFAEILEARGVFTLNMGYEWGCTTGAYRNEEQDSVSMLRTLDWPFPQLGKQVMVLWQTNKAGDFYNVSWPGVAGMTTGMAPGRFSTAINMAPMRGHRLGFAGDWLVNRRISGNATGLPPTHLLRRVFEQAADYDTAKRMLTETPVAAPVIFTLAGIQPGQGCVIERLETRAHIFELSAGQQITTANHFNGPFAAEGHWHPREYDSAGRYRQSCSIHGHDLQAANFNWLTAPIINPYTRLAVIADAATNRLMVQGYEGPAQVTELFNLPLDRYEQRQAS